MQALMRETQTTRARAANRQAAPSVEARAGRNGAAANGGCGIEYGAPRNRLGRFLRDYRQRTATPLKEIAAGMERNPAAVARLETQLDHAWTLYSLQRYAAAVGARLGVVLIFPGEEHKPGVVLSEPPPDWRSKWVR